MPVTNTRVDAAKLTILVDNQATGGLGAEHGLSVWVEAAGRRILFDTGQGNVLAGNAAKLGVELERTDALVISHGHYDHTGGLALVVQRAPHAELYGHPSLPVPRYSIRGGVVRDIALPASARMALDCLTSGKLHFSPNAREIAPGVGITGSIPRLNGYEGTGGCFFLDRQRNKRDLIEDDLALWLSTPRGLVVVLGCGHSGVINTLECVTRFAGESRIHVVLGGFHLLDASEVRLERTLRALADLSPDLIVPCHCTGEVAIERLGRALGKRVRRGHAGMTLELGGNPSHRS